MPTATQLNAVDYGFTPTAANPSAALTSAVNAAIAQGKPLYIEPGAYVIGNVSINGPLDLVGVPGKVTLRQSSGSNAILRIVNFTAVTITGVDFDGANVTPVDAYGAGFAGAVLAQRTNSTVSTLRIVDCKFRRSGGYGLVVSKCAATVTGSEFSALYAAAAVTDNEGFAFERNRVTTMDNNGVFVTRSAGTPVSTRIVGNSFDDIRITIPESTGYQGNAVLCALESNIVVAQNNIHNVKFSAIRMNGCTRVRVTENHCDLHGDNAIYFEGFSDGAQIANDGYDGVIANNVVNDAGGGIAIGNSNVSGRLVVVSGNVVRRITAKVVAGGTDSEYTLPGVAIGAETCVIIANNFIENAVRGVEVSGNSATADSIVTGNVVRQTTLAIGVSTVSGAKDVMVSNNIAAGYASVASGGGALRPLTFGDDVVSGSADLASFTESVANANLRIEGVVKRATL